MLIAPILTAVDSAEELMGRGRNSDPIPQHYGRSIYQRTDYIVNSDMSIPDALAGTLLYGFATEIAARTGLPQQDRRPHTTPFTLYRNQVLERKK